LFGSNTKLYREKTLIQTLELVLTYTARVMYSP